MAHDEQRWLSPRLQKAAALCNQAPAASESPLWLGIDLGTCDVVSMVVDRDGQPVAVCLDWADVVRDGIVWDFFGAVTLVRRHLATLEQQLGCRFTHAATSFPPGTDPRISINVLESAGLEISHVLDEPTAVADLLQLDNAGVVDIGGGTSDIAVISLSGVVESASIKVAGDQFNESIVKYMRRKHNILIGERTAEQMKMEIGCVYPKEEEATIEIKGRCLMTGLPRTFTVSSTEVLEALEEVSSAIVEAIHSVLERTPPELTGDISSNGIVMTGGGSLICGFDKLVASKTGIPTRVADEAVSCVAYGTGNCLENLSRMQDGTINLSRQRQLKGNR